LPSMGSQNNIFAKRIKEIFVANSFSLSLL